jgi:hypothetical protein
VRQCRPDAQEGEALLSGFGQGRDRALCLPTRIEPIGMCHDLHWVLRRGVLYHVAHQYRLWIRWRALCSLHASADLRRRDRAWRLRLHPDDHLSAAPELWQHRQRLRYWHARLRRVHGRRYVWRWHATNPERLRLYASLSQQYLRRYWRWVWWHGLLQHLPESHADLRGRQPVRAMCTFGGVRTAPSLPERVVLRLQRL